MKTLLLLLLIIPFTGHGQKTAVMEVAGRAEMLRVAILKRDAAALDELTSNDLSYGHSSGAVDDKKAFIERQTKHATITSLAITDQSLTLSGDDAIVRHHFIGDTVDKGKPGKIDILVLMVWHKEAGIWKLLARQGIKII